MNGLYGRTIPEALMGGLTGGEQGQPRVILVEPDGQDYAFTAPQLRTMICSAAWQARSAGIRPGEPVLLLFEHGLPVIQAFLGLVMAGAVPCLLPYWTGSAASHSHTTAEVYRLAATSGARWVATSSALSGMLGELLVSEPLRVFALQEQDSEFTDEAPPLPELDAEATAYLQLTSGTTDVPKLIAVSHHALLNHMRALHSHLALGATDTFVGWLPLHHDMGLIIQLWLPLIASARTVLIPPHYWVRRPRVLFQAVSRYTGTITFMPNFAFNHCTRYVSDKELRDLDLTRWRRVINGAEPVCAATMQAFAERLAGCSLPKTALGVGYGLGENVGGVTISCSGQPLLVDWISALALQESNQAVTVGPTHSDALAVVSCGHPIPGTEVTILDRQRQAVSDRGLGEIAIRGASLCNAYAGVGPIPDDTGWCLTGDIGYLSDGQLYVCDRKTDLIITGGRNIHPQWLEGLATDVIGASAGQAAAFAVTDSLLGTELPVLVCEARGRFEAVQQAGWASEIRRRAQDELHISLADIQVVRRGWVEQTTSGKIARRATREKYLAAGYRPQNPTATLLPTLLSDPVMLEAALLALVGQMLSVTSVQPNDNFFALGGDSLTALRMVLAVEEATGQRVPTEFFREPTVAHLVRLLASEHLTAATPAVTPPVIDAPAQPTVPRRPAAHPARRLARRLQATPQRVRVQVRSIFEAHALRKPYFEGIQWLLNWCGRSWVQALLYPQESRLVRRFAASMGTPAGRVAQETQLSLVSHIIRARKQTGLPPDKQIRLITESIEAAEHYSLYGEDWIRYFDLEGAAFLEDAIHQKRGLICVGPHTVNGFAVGQFLIRRCDRHLIVGHQAYLKTWHDLLEVQSITFTEGKAVARASVAVAAARTLAEGGAIGIAGDQEDIHGGLPMRIGDRLHHLVYGFAELAVTTSATILPIYTQLLTDGRIKIQILAPLIWERGETREEQIRQIVQAYAALQTDLWRHAPGALLDITIRRHLACGQAGEPA